MYANTTASVNSYVQTSLNPMKDPIRTKQALKVGIEATLTNSSIITVSVDSETGSSPSVELGQTDAKQYGKYLGMTVTSTNAGVVYNGFEYEHELRVRF